MIDLITIFIITVLVGFGASFFLMLFHKLGLMRYLEFKSYILWVRYLVPACDFCMSFRLVLILLLVAYQMFALNIYHFVIYLICATALSTTMTK